MPPTLTPTGSIGKALCNLAWLVASSSTFQTLVGAANATAALDFVFFEADDTSDATPRPRALVFFGKYISTQTAIQTFDVKSDLLLSFEFAPSNTYLASGNIFDQAVEFCNRIDGIVDDMMALQGQGSTGYISGESYMYVSAFELVDGPGAITETTGIGTADARDYFWGATFNVHRRGR